MGKLLMVILAALCALDAAAQTPANPLSTWLRDAFTRNSSNILRTAEKMPEENYGLRPGPQMEATSQITTIFGARSRKARKIRTPATISQSSLLKPSSSRH